MRAKSNFNMRPWQFWSYWTAPSTWHRETLKYTDLHRTNCYAMRLQDSKCIPRVTFAETDTLVG